MISFSKSAMVFTIIALTSSTVAQEAMKIEPEQIVWKDHPVFAGIQSAVLFGDPTKSEMYVIRSKLPPNYATPAHMHPNSEVLTVISGRLGVGMGEKNQKRGEMLKPDQDARHGPRPPTRPAAPWSQDVET